MIRVSKIRSKSMYFNTLFFKTVCSIIHEIDSIITRYVYSLSKNAKQYALFYIISYMGSDTR